MPDYEIAPAVEDDLLEIARYAIRTWGLAQADRYESAIKEHFQAIGNGTIRARRFLDHRPELLFSRCEHHNVFFLNRRNACPLILAVLHESMDLIARVRNRLAIQESQ